MIIKDYRDQTHRENYAAGDAPPELVPDRVESYFLAKPFSLHITAVKIVGKDRQQRAEHKLKHGRAPSVALQPAWPPRCRHPAWSHVVRQAFRPRRPVARCRSYHPNRHLRPA